MAKPGKRNFRRAIEAHGGIVTEIAKHFDVTRATIYNWLTHYQMRDDLRKARQSMREIAQDIVYARLLSDNEDKSFEAARFTLLHLRNDGELLMLSPETIRILDQLGINMATVAQHVEVLAQQKLLEMNGNPPLPADVVQGEAR